jgi:hypothetical protein
MADIKLEVEYGGYSIRWVDFDRTFDLFRDDVKVKSAITTVQSCKEWIDGKNKRKYRRVSILSRFGWSGPLLLGEATSLIDDEYVWAVGPDKVRAKKKIEDCWLDTPENRQVLEKIKSLGAQSAQIDKEIKSLEDATARLTADMMLEGE